MTDTEGELQTQHFNFHMFIEDDVATRESIHPHSQEIFQQLANTVLTHLTSPETKAGMHMASIFYSFAVRSKDAGNAFLQKFNKQELSFESIKEDVYDYLRNKTPAVIFANINVGEHIIWGQVFQEDDHAYSNEMYLSAEHMDAIIGSAPPDLPQEEAELLTAYHLLRWKISFVQQLMNCISKYLFPKVTFSPTVLQKEKGLTDAGKTFESSYHEYHVEMSIPTRQNIEGKQFWIPETEIIATLHNREMVKGKMVEVVLDAATLDKLNEGFSKRKLFDLAETDLPAPVEREWIIMGGCGTHDY